MFDIGIDEEKVSKVLENFTTGIHGSCSAVIHLEGIVLCTYPKDQFKIGNRKWTEKDFKSIAIAIKNFESNNSLRKIGEFKDFFFEIGDELFMVTPAGTEILMIGVTKKTIKQGLLFHQIKRSASEVKEILRGW